jgi:BASS family bile acid:Na+ symporter
MNLQTVLNIVALVTLGEMMIYVGLGASVAEFVKTLRNARLVALGILANYVLFPAMTVGLLLVFQVNPLAAIGFLLIAVCPAGPYGPPYTAIAKGNVGEAAGLMLVLAGLAPLLSPPLLHVLTPMVSGDQTVRVDMLTVVMTLLFGQLLPLLAGLAVNYRRPCLAAKWVKPAGQLTKLLNVVFLSLVFYTQFESLLKIRLLGYAGMLVLVIGGVAVGWLLGGRDRDDRKAMALTTGVRNNGLSLAIATGAFAGTPAVTAAAVFGCVGFLGVLVIAVVWGKLSPSAAPGGSRWCRSR